MIKLDFSIDDPQERLKVVEQILAENPEPNEKYLNTLTDYLILCMEKQEKKQKKILTDNRMTTVNKRETSFEGLVSQFENGEDGIYNLITNNKNIIFQPKVSITQKDLDDIEPLRQLREAIQIWEQKLKTATGKDVYVIKHTLIELRKDQYVIKNAYRKPIVMNKLSHTTMPTLLESEEWIEPNGDVGYKGISLLDPKVCETILCNYSRLWEDAYGHFNGDLWYLMEDFERTCDKALAPFPLYLRLIEYKIDGVQNIEIQTRLQQEFGIKHSIEYISSLWRNKIPRLIADAAEDDFLNWYYLVVEKGKYKKCSRCGKIKLAHNKYFSKNKTSRDSFYSICKECRNSKDEDGQEWLKEEYLE